MGPIVHADFLSLRPEARKNERPSLIAAASGLTDVQGVAGVVVIESRPGSDADLVFFWILNGLPDLEHFGSDGRYVAYLQRTLAPHILGLSGIDIRLETGLPAVGRECVSLAVTATDETYDWQVRSDLSTWAEAIAPDAFAVGIAVGERQRYRGLAIAFIEELTLPLPPAPLGYVTTVAAGPAQRLD